MKNSCFVVAGPARTGSSLTMGILEGLGVYMGEHEHFRKSRGNPVTYEHMDLIDYVRNKVSKDRALNRIKQENKPWGFKVPRPQTKKGLEILELVPQAKFVVTNRRSKSAWLKSFRRCIGRTSYDYYEVLNGIVSTIGDRLWTNVYFEDWFTCPKDQLHRVCEFLGLPYNEKALEIIDPAEKHF